MNAQEDYIVQLKQYEDLTPRELRSRTNEILAIAKRANADHVPTLNSELFEVEQRIYAKIEGSYNQ